MIVKAKQNGIVYHTNNIHFTDVVPMHYTLNESKNVKFKEVIDMLVYNQHVTIYVFKSVKLKNENNNTRKEKSYHRTIRIDFIEGNSKG